jgi:hypothetical protein
MPTCKECQYAVFDQGDPTYIVCLRDSKELSAEESLTSAQSRIVPGKRLKSSTEACEHFELKRRRRTLKPEEYREELRRTY